MKALTKFALAAVMLITTLTAQAGGVSGYYRSSGTYVAPYYRSDYGSVGRSYGSSSGYVYRNPYAAYPSVQRERILPQHRHVRGASRPHRPQLDRDRQPQLPRLRHHPRAQILLPLVTNASRLKRHPPGAMKALTKLAFAALMAASAFTRPSVLPNPSQEWSEPHR